ncbi:hypothetical protein CROQUDRAFT_361803 [Cronartium quercuum f. sp. fusiforme G11]|uniref:Uncharacterized protein n=1 Tax=Cronartium quercuum f. sp. fusiforme G11 TaxID=708437 RepID=A0A9P6TE60_9BASI|nr:hypothetical protein CROQUDRAFT_361803 [Cronartium quercuum f. sp. fusiforme G11]
MSSEDLPGNATKAILSEFSSILTHRFLLYIRLDCCVLPSLLQIFYRNWRPRESWRQGCDRIYRERYFTEIYDASSIALVGVLLDVVSSAIFLPGFYVGRHYEFQGIYRRMAIVLCFLIHYHLSQLLRTQVLLSLRCVISCFP